MFYLVKNKQMLDNPDNVGLKNSLNLSLSKIISANIKSIVQCRSATQGTDIDRQDTAYKEAKS